MSDTRTAARTRRTGIPQHQMGPTFDYHGPRAPFRIDVAEVISLMPQTTLAALDAWTVLARRAARTASAPSATWTSHSSFAA